MRNYGFTRLKNGQSFWKCHKWGLKSALRRKKCKKHCVKEIELENTLNRGNDRGRKHINW